MTIRETNDEPSNGGNFDLEVVNQRTSFQDIELEVLKEKQAACDNDQLTKVEEGSSTWKQQSNKAPPSFTLLERVDKDDPQLPESIRELLDPSMSPDERNRLVYTRPEHEQAFGHGPNTYYPDHIPLPGCCHWFISIICLALGGVILSVEITTHEGPVGAVTAAVIVLLMCVAPALWCLWWGRSSHLKRKALYVDGEDFPGRWRQGYYTIGTAALVDYNEKTGVCVFPVENIVSMYRKTTGGGESRSTSHYLVYRTTLEEETRNNEEEGRKGWFGRRKRSTVQKKITVGSQGDHLVYWWKHSVKGIPT